LTRFWRICRRLHAADAASGEGARLYGGRWNSRGVRVAYASTSLALAAVETFVNLEPKLRPADLISIEGAIPASLRISRLDTKTLPEGRREAHGEWNVLLNPAHRDFSAIRVQDPLPFEFDLRMFRGP